jgi:uncharacterized membrane protein YhaH (DUF805 family)
VLRLKPESSLDEAGKVFDAQAVRLDPERIKDSLRPAAESKMAQVKEAWDVVRDHLESGGGPVSLEVAPVQERSQPITPTITEPRPVGISLNPVAGWHVQPDGRQRFWDGEQWTERVLWPAERRMSFPEAISSCLTRYAALSGRARRSEYWWLSLFALIVGLGAQILDDVLNAQGMLQLLILLGLCLPMLAVTVRRLHDTNRSGWSIFLFMIPVFGYVVWLVHMCQDSSEGPNLYGPSPKYA